MKHVSTIIMILFMIGCGRQERTDSEAENTTPIESTGTMDIGNAQTIYYLNDSTNQQIAEIQYDQVQDKWGIIYGDKYFEGVVKDDKRKFYAKNGDTFAEIKFKDEDFKLRKANGELLWKIKTYDQKIKISDNEEMNNAYEIRVENQYFAHLEHGDQEIGSIELSPENNPAIIKGKQQFYYFRGPNLTISPALMLIDEISNEHKLMIMAELISREK